LAKYWGLFTENLTKTKMLIHSEKNKELFSILECAISDWEKVHMEVIETASKEEFTEPRQSVSLSFGLAREKIQAVDDTLGEISNMNEHNAREFADEAARIYNSSRTFMIGLIIVSVVFSIILGVFISNSISKSLMVKAAEGIGQGDPSVSDGYKSGDDVGTFAVAFTEMTRKLMSGFYNLKTATKLITGSLTISVIAAILGIVGVINMGTMNSMTEQMYKKELMGISYIKEAKIDLVYIHRNEKNYIMAMTDEDRQYYKKRLGKYWGLFRKNLTRAKLLIYSERNKELFSILECAISDWEEVHTQVIETASKEKLTEARQAASLSFRLAREKIQAVDDTLGEISNMNKLNAQEFADKTVRIYNGSRTFMIGLIIVSVIFSMILGVFISNSISNPLKDMVKAAESVGQGDLTVSVGYKSRDEVGTLAVAFTEMTRKLSLSRQQLEQYSENLKDERNRLKAANKKITESIQYASMIQNSLLPQEVIICKYFSEDFVIWQPKDIVGGDIYIVDEFSEGDECVIAVIDCTGHGVPGAFVTMLARTTWANMAYGINTDTDSISPGRIFSILNKSIRELLKQDAVEGPRNSKEQAQQINVGFEGGLLYFNRKHGIVRYAGANVPLIVCREGHVDIIKGDRQGVGYKNSNPDYVYRDIELNVVQGDMFYITTDGYIDQNGGDKDLPFGRSRLVSIIKDNWHRPMSEQRDAFLVQLSIFQGQADRNDDITVVGLKI
ncbi:MAG: MCP four helix bundle domain-containing protein, partial [Nitrospirae bacterium]|nr:MCP four helix bundle domain-containing protein [Nitrospirota bacterium]